MAENSEDLAAIAGRNRLRGQASLPLLDVGAELRRLKKVRDEANFDRYVSCELHRFKQIIDARQGWFAKMGAYNQIRQRLRVEWRSHSQSG